MPKKIGRSVLMRDRIWSAAGRCSVVPLLAAAIWFAGCAGDSSDQHAGGGMPGMANGRPNAAAIPVQVAEVRRGEIAMFLLHTTTIEAEKEVQVVAKISGQVIDLPAEEGMDVRKGAILAQLDEAELRIELLQSKAKMETDKAAFERAKSMLEKQLISQENFDVTRLQYENSKAAYEAAELKIKYMNVRAPISGIVTARLVELGQRVNVNQVLFHVADFKPLRAKIYVPEKDVARIFEGQGAKIVVDALPDMAFRGTVKMVSPVVDPTNGTVKVTIDINDTRGKLKPGMFTSVYITTESRKNTLLIPKKALLLESETDQVYKYENGIARKAILQLGFSTADTVEVLSGLNEGDLVVTVGQEGLREGLPVRIPGKETQVTERPAGRQQGRMASGEAPNLGQEKAVDPANAPVDEALVKRLEQKLANNRMIQMGMQRRAEQDPDFATNPAKKLAFFEEAIDRMAGFIMRNQQAQAAWQKRVEADPALEKNLEKKVDFFLEMRGKFGGRGRRTN